MNLIRASARNVPKAVPLFHMSYHQIHGGLLDSGVFAKAGQPFDTGLFAEPRYLTLRVAPCISLRFYKRLLGSHLATQHLQCLAIAVGFERLR